MKKKLINIFCVIFIIPIILFGCTKEETTNIHEYIDNALQSQSNYEKSYIATFNDEDKNYIEVFIVTKDDKINDIVREINRLSLRKYDVEEVKINIEELKDEEYEILQTIIK